MKHFIKILLSLGIFFISIIIAINIVVISNTKGRIYTVEELKEEEYDAILVLGAGLKNNKPSKMLKERLDAAKELYDNKIANVIIVSGDHGRINYDEVNVMKQYLIDNGIPSEDIYMDHAGFNTYDSMYRAKSIFGVDSMVVVTQKYHLYRAMYIAKRLGIKVSGYDALKKTYSGQTYRNIREVLARVKDFFLALFKMPATVLGDTIDIHSTGDVTNDYYVYIASLEDDQTHYVKDKDIADKIMNLTKGEFQKRDCDGTASYTMKINGSANYTLEIFGDNIHIVNDDEELILNAEDAKIIFDILNNN